MKKVIESEREKCGIDQKKKTTRHRGVKLEQDRYGIGAHSYD